MSYTIDYVSNWQLRLASRLYLQFRNAVTWQKWTAVLGKQFQDLEDATQSLLGVWDFQNNSGVLLDIVGNLIGQPRLGANDATYLVYIAGRIIASKSTGTPEDIFSVMRALFGANAGPRYFGGYNKQFSITITTPLTPAQAQIGLSFLDDTKEAAARAVFLWQEYPSSQMFTFDSGFGSTDPNLGFGDTGNANTGGFFAAAAQE